MGTNEPAPPYDLSGYVPASNRPLRRLRLRLHGLFPEDAAYADKQYAENWSIELGGAWLTYFAEATAAAMKRRDDERVVAHLNLFSKMLPRCGEYMKGLIDVNYMEDLFYNLDVRSTRWGWRRVPDNLKKLYVDYWSGIIPRYVERLERPKR